MPATAAPEMAVAIWRERKKKIEGGEENRGHGERNLVTVFEF